MMTALGSAVSPQACRQARIKRLSSRRHRPSRVQRANRVYSVPNGMSHSWPMARHCMPQKQTWRNRSDTAGAAAALSPRKGVGLRAAARSSAKVW